MSFLHASAAGRAISWVFVAVATSVSASYADSAMPLRSLDETYETQVDPSLSYRPLVSAPSWVVP
jgi:hypothetical protein